ncbi:receptor-like protein 9DC3 [Daucus carota subsp. sativus]|uniref:receptor-like protein 9DC3 n=1 Tax=Daucus carota subsp. sativus TaxID=79200 RepID=UPI003082BAA7
MDLSHNQFSGDLPISFLDNFRVAVNSDELADMDLENTDTGSYYEASVTLIVKGLEVEVKRILSIYTSIDLSSNKFTGELLEVIGVLQSLRLLNVSHNRLLGHIPSSLGNMSIIPWQLTSLTFLSNLNLSENHLTGAIPKGRQFDTFSNESFMGNAALCGVPLMKKMWK